MRSFVPIFRHAPRLREPWRVRPRRPPMSKRLRRDLRLTAVLAGISLAVTLLGLTSGALAIPLALLTLLFGIGCGALTSRVYRFHWDHAASQVVARIDRIGIVILVVYALFALARMQVITVPGLDLNLSLAGRSALAAGMAVGRLCVSLASIHAVANVMNGQDEL